MRENIVRPIVSTTLSAALLFSPPLYSNSSFDRIIYNEHNYNRAYMTSNTYKNADFFENINKCIKAAPINNTNITHAKILFGEMRDFTEDEKEAYNLVLSELKLTPVRNFFDRS